MSASEEILVQRFLAETLSDEDAAELLQLLRSRPDFVRVIRDQQDVDFLLQLQGRIKDEALAEVLNAECAVGHDMPAARPLPLWKKWSATGQNDAGFEPSTALDWNTLTRLAAESPALPIPAPAPPEKPARPIVYARKESKSWPALKVLVPLLLLVFGIMVYLEFHPVPEDAVADDPFGPFPARVVELVDAAFEDGDRPLKKDERLEAGPIALRAGLLEIEYKNGIRVVLEGPAKYHLETPLEAACDLGKLSAHVPPGGRGFTVTTPMMTVRDLGTKFLLDVTESDTKLQVVEGEVEANWLTRDWLPLKSGRGIERREGREVRNFVADPKSYVSGEAVEKRRAEFVAATRTAWDAARRRRKADPALVYCLEPETVAGLARTTGDRDDTTAIRFRNRNDRLDVAPGRECRDLTLIALVRLNNLSGNTNVLVTGNELGAATGEFLWQMNRYGELHFHVDRGGRTVDQFNSPAVFGPRDCKSWQRVAVVADADNRTIVHYRDGIPVATLPWKQPIPLRLDRLTVGNESSRARRSTVRHFNGDIEEFWIFARPLTAEEIREWTMDD